MRATSTASLEAASGWWEPVLVVAGERAVQFGRQLYELADLVAATPALAKALSDPARSAQDKAALAERLTADAVLEDVSRLVTRLARSRWSEPEDVARALEVLAVDSVLAAAQARGELETVEDELFRFERLLAAERELRLSLGDKDIALERRLALLAEVLGKKAQPEVELFARRAVITSAKRGLFSTLHEVGERAAERRSRLVATVVAAARLSEDQMERLQGILERAYGREVQVNVGVDSRLVGGLKVTVGAHVMDASVLGRLDEARRRLAG